MIALVTIFMKEIGMAFHFTDIKNNVFTRTLNDKCGSNNKELIKELIQNVYRYMDEGKNLKVHLRLKVKIY